MSVGNEVDEIEERLRDTGLGDLKGPDSQAVPGNGWSDAGGNPCIVE